jgi:microcystin-dependent protein
MVTPYIGEIRMFAGNFAPLGWQLCDGQLMAINANQALFAILGTTYGGDGISTSSHVIGELGGAEQVALTVNQLPSHQHALIATEAEASAANPSGQLPARSPKYVSGGMPNAALGAQTIQPTGGNQPHENMPPFQVVNFIIALQGIFPSQN